MDVALVKAAAKGRQAAERQRSSLRHAALVLCLHHLRGHGLCQSYACLSAECGVSLDQVDAADNVTLLRIIQEWEAEQEARLGMAPKLVRRQTARLASDQPPACPAAACACSPVSGQMAARLRREKAAAAAAAPQPDPGQQAQQQPPGRCGRVLSHQASSRQRAEAPPEVQPVAGSQPDAAATGAPDLQVSGQAAARRPRHRGARSSSGGSSGSGSDSEAPRLLKPMPASLLGELRELGAAISRDICCESPNVAWDDIKGLAEAKRLLQEAVVLPLRYPQLFAGLLAPWRGLLLFGPPGTGKTLLAKAVATRCKTTFFNISASTIVSKWRGDSEKLVRVLFDLARHHAPSTIFLDEVDALGGARGAEGEHEASRRMKTELLLQMDGLVRSEARVFVLSATNLPWDLDMALLRRLEKRILVPLPGAEARLAMLQSLLAGRAGPGADLAALAASPTEGFSGADVALLAKEAAMRPLRRLMAVLEPGVYGGAGAGADEDAQPGSSAAVLGPVTAQDLAAALAATKASGSAFAARYAEFAARFASQPA